MRPITFLPPAHKLQAPSRWACVDASVTCRRCHHEWPDGDPAYQMACRGCGALWANPAAVQKAGTSVCASSVIRMRAGQGC